jgi:hypothetical protein
VADKPACRKGETELPEKSPLRQVRSPKGKFPLTPFFVKYGSRLDWELALGVPWVSKRKGI